MTHQTRTTGKKMLIIWVLAVIVGRLIPHPYSATPELSLALFSGFVFKRWPSILATVLGLLISDMLLAWAFHYPVFGLWSLFNYSGLLAITLCAGLVTQPPLLRTLGYTFIAALGFWLWTNFGTWLSTSDMYPHTFAGLLTCYVAGLAFLKNALIGSLAWSVVIKASLSFAKKHPLMTP